MRSERSDNTEGPRGMSFGVLLLAEESMSQDSLVPGILVLMSGGLFFLRGGDSLFFSCFWSVLCSLIVVCEICFCVDDVHGETFRGFIGCDTIEEEGELEKNDIGCLNSCSSTDFRKLSWSPRKRGVGS